MMLSLNAADSLSVVKRWQL